MGTVSLRNPYKGFTTQGNAAKLVRKATCSNKHSSTCHGSAVHLQTSLTNALNAELLASVSIAKGHDPFDMSQSHASCTLQGVPPQHEDKQRQEQDRMHGLHTDLLGRDMTPLGYDCQSMLTEAGSRWNSSLYMKDTPSRERPRMPCTKYTAQDRSMLSQQS